MRSAEALADSDKRTTRGLWPLWVFVAVCLAVDAAALPLIEWIEPRSLDMQILALLTVSGLMCGQGCFVVLISGLARRTALGGFFLGLLLAVLGYVAIALGAWLINESDLEILMGLGMLPAFLFSAAAPLYVLRQLRGWRLVHQSAKPSKRQPLLLEDLLGLMPLAGAGVVLLRAPLVIAEGDDADYWIAAAITCAVFFGIGLVLMPAATKLAFGVKSRWTTVIGLAALALLGSAVVVAIVQFSMPWTSARGQRTEVLPYVLAPLGAAFSVFYVSLWLLHASGIRMAPPLFLQKARPDQLLDRNLGEQIELARQRTRSRWRIAAAVLVTVVISAALASLESWRKTRDADNRRISELAKSLGGGIGIDDRVITYLHLGARATDEDILRFRECRGVRKLELASPQITDRGVAHLSYFAGINQLLLNGSGVTDRGLSQLGVLERLYRLEINNTQITGAGLVHVSDPAALTVLFADNSDFDDAGCEQLPRFKNLYEVSLRGTQVTDNGCRHVVNLSNLYSIDLSETTISGQGVRGCRNARVIVLDDTLVDDAGLLGLADSALLRELSLDNTRITGRTFSQFGGLTNLISLSVAGAPVNDEGLAAMDALPALVELDASNTQVTGEGFRRWKPLPGLQSLHLDGAPVDDAGIAHLQNFASLHTLSLANTRVTDGCLPLLATLPITWLNLSNTKVTAAGLARSRMTTPHSLIVAPGQFTRAEITRIEQSLTIEIEIVDPNEAEEESE